MKLLTSLFIAWCFGVSVAQADKTVPTSIDEQALKNKRLFFSESQRQAGNIGEKLHKQSTKSVASNPTVPSEAPIDLRSDDALHYTGIVYSERGAQLLLNGYPWLPGQLGVISARLQPETQQIEIKTAAGTQHLLLPGDTVEMRP